MGDGDNREYTSNRSYRKQPLLLLSRVQGIVEKQALCLPSVYRRSLVYRLFITIVVCIWVSQFKLCIFQFISIVTVYDGKTKCGIPVIYLHLRQFTTTHMYKLYSTLITVNHKISLTAFFFCFRNCIRGPANYVFLNYCV